LLDSSASLSLMVQNKFDCARCSPWRRRAVWTI